MSENRCYYCGKTIEKEEDMIMKNVQAGLLGLASERKPFHTGCWRKYHSIRMKKDAIGYVAIGDGAVLLFGIGLFLIFGIIGLIVMGLCFALLICLVVAYYRIEE